MAYKLKRGVFVVTEGIDCTGKSSLTKKLPSILKDMGFSAVATKEPGDNMIGEEMCTALKKAGTMCPKAEFLVFSADRAQHFHEVVIPHLNDNQIVISDRLHYSSMAYQGYGKGLDIEIIKSISNWAMCGVNPDLVLHLKMPVDVVWSRMEKRGQTQTPFEGYGLDKIDQAFDKIFSEMDNVVTVDATADMDSVAQTSAKHIVSFLQSKGFVQP